MASRNEEVLARAFEAWNARDLAAVRELIDPEFEFAPHITGGFEGITFRGIDGFERFIRTSDEVQESMHVDASEVHRSGDVMAVLGHLRAHDPAAVARVLADAGLPHDAFDAQARLVDLGERGTVAALCSVRARYSAPEMSREAMETWRASIEDVRACRGESDWERWLARAAELWDAEIEWDASELPVPDISGVFRRKEAVRGWWREWLAAWGSLDFEYELVDAGDEVVMLLEQHMSGRFSGIETTGARYAQVATFRNGRMVRWKVYARQSDALKAVGLRDQARPTSAPDTALPSSRMRRDFA